MSLSADWGGDLEMFVLVVDAGSFSAAARHLNLAPSSVSRVINQIEARLGVRLLLRTTRSLTVTPEGATYLSAARRILADFQEMEQLVSNQSSPRGREGFVAESSLGQYPFASACDACRTRSASTRIRLSCSDHRSMGTRSGVRQPSRAKLRYSR
jgi:DNA-binding transcriptional LysR family regulator